MVQGRAIAAACAAGVISLSFALTPETLPHITICPMMRFFGLPCPSCGMTRGFIAIAHGRFGEAWTFNPFSFVFFALAIAFVLGPFWRPGLLAGTRARVAVASVVALLSAMWIWDLYRIFAMVA